MALLSVTDLRSHTEGRGALAISFTKLTLVCLIHTAIAE